MNDIEFSLKPSATEWEIVSLILASVLFNQPRTWSRNDERIPNVVMLFAVMDICVKGHDIPHPGVTKIPHPISQD